MFPSNTNNTALQNTCECSSGTKFITNKINPLNAELNPICHLLALLGAHHIFHVSGLRVKIKFNKIQSVVTRLGFSFHTLSSTVYQLHPVISLPVEMCSHHNAQFHVLTFTMRYLSGTTWCQLFPESMRTVRILHIP